MKNKRPGFATVTALVLLSLVGLTIAGLMTRVSMDARRARREIDRAQKEQITIALSLQRNIKLSDQILREAVPRTVEGSSRGVAEPLFAKGTSH